MAQLVARDVWDVDAAGSNPVTPTISSVRNGFTGTLFLIKSVMNTRTIWALNSDFQSLLFVSTDTNFEG